MKRKALWAAVPYTVPVMLGYLFLGAAFGVLIAENGFSVLWAFLMSTFIYAGSMQFAAISLMTSAFSPVSAFLLTLMVNARHLFYGLSMLKPFERMGKRKPYMIFSLTDETYSLLCGVSAPEGIDPDWFLFLSRCSINSTGSSDPVSALLPAASCLLIPQALTLP